MNAIGITSIYIHLLKILQETLMRQNRRSIACKRSMNPNVVSQS